MSGVGLITECGVVSGRKRSGIRATRPGRGARESGPARTAGAAVGGEVATRDGTVELGKSGLEVTSIGIGAWSWGDTSGYWGYGKEYGREAGLEAYKALMDAGITFIDTAEVYGFGNSEKFLGEFAKEASSTPVIATKFAPYPWRLSAESVPIALKASLKRLQVDSIGLYMIHWPGFFWNAFFNDAYVEGLAKCVDEGLTKAVGVSNFNNERVRSAHKALAARGVPLASNQVQYSLLYRNPETNGVLEACRELGVTLVAYCPLAQGLLTGKYTETNLPTGPRANAITADRVRQVQPLLKLMKEIGDAHGGKTQSQVAINWTMCKGVLPIPGAKNASQVQEIVGCLGWRLTDDEVSALDVISAKLPPAGGAPFENW
ncbi:unnamed protein product [Ostreobium quekettii]|uniref:NADP-dependent oxidoreductase domain-containing protein n=1 Tax=Ostreobium quekettii TaxID=121088 RepID=A0A8S1J2N3_9CHLO|nr:unnamed protein product [Ostreobium quekettii]